MCWLTLYIYTHIYIHTYIHIYMHIYIYIYMFIGHTAVFQLPLGEPLDTAGDRRGADADNSERKFPPGERRPLLLACIQGWRKGTNSNRFGITPIYISVYMYISIYAYLYLKQYVYL